MADISQLTPIPGTKLSEGDVRRLESNLGSAVPNGLRNFLLEIGYASFIDVGFAYIKIGSQNAAFGQFYGKEPDMHFDPSDLESGALRIGDVKSHYPSGSLIFAGDELGGEYFIMNSEGGHGIYWMIYGEQSDYEWVCANFSDFVSLINIDPYDDA